MNSLHRAFVVAALLVSAGVVAAREMAQSPNAFGIPTPDNAQPTATIRAVPGTRAQGWPQQGRSKSWHGMAWSRRAILSPLRPDSTFSSGEAMRLTRRLLPALSLMSRRRTTRALEETFLRSSGQPRDKKLYALNSAGWAPSGWTPEFFTSQLKVRSIPNSGVNAATVPGAVSGYDALLKRFGTLTFKETFESAAQIAEQGWGQAERRASDLRGAANGLRDDPDSRQTFLVGGQPPALYAILRNPQLATALRLIQKDGRDAFYRGPIASAIVAKVRANGGVMDLKDLEEFQSEWVDPISTNYHGYDVYELPPPGQGFAALEMLNILEVCVPKLGFNLASLGPSDPMYWHLLIEAKKLAYADLNAYNADPKFKAVPIERLLSKTYAATRCSRISPEKASSPPNTGGLDGGTIYLTTADRWGNMVSLIHSVFSVYGSRATVPPLWVCPAQSRRCILVERCKPECRGATQAAVPYHYRGLRCEGWSTADDVRQHGRQRAARNPCAAHDQPDRPGDERADDDGRRAVHAFRRTVCHA
jgi:gamma-glutamyltranspeptidase/glutathione hydrolase